MAGGEHGAGANGLQEQDHTGALEEGRGGVNQNQPGCENTDQALSLSSTSNQPMLSVQFVQKILAEIFGTYFLIFAGCAAVAVNKRTAGTVTFPGICITWGLAVMVMVYSVGHISGAHFNPAVQERQYNTVAGFYCHHSTGEYRVLWVSQSHDSSKSSLYVLTVGSHKPRRVRVRMPTASSPSVEQKLLYKLRFSSDCLPPVHHRGSLHWRPSGAQRHYGRRRRHYCVRHRSRVIPLDARSHSAMPL